MCFTESANRFDNKIEALFTQELEKDRKLYLQKLLRLLFTFIL